MAKKVEYCDTCERTELEVNVDGYDLNEIRHEIGAPSLRCDECVDAILQKQINRGG